MKEVAFNNKIFSAWDKEQVCAILVRQMILMAFYLL